MTQGMLLLIMGGLCAVMGVLALLVWSGFHRYRHRVTELAAEAVELAAGSATARRVATGGASAEVVDLGGAINSLLETLNSRQRLQRDGAELFHQFAAAVPEVVVIHDEQILYANAAAGALLGVDANELVGRPVIDLVRPAYRALTRKIVALQLAGEKIDRKVELQLVDREERPRWAEATGLLIEYRGRSAVLTVARDVTLRKTMAATLSRGRRQAQITLESIGEGVITTDTEGRIDYMNTAAEQLTATTREQAKGQLLGNIVRLVDEKDRRELTDPIAQCLVKRQRISMGRRASLMQQNSDKEMSVDMTASPIIAPDKSIAGAVVVIRDVTELRGMTREMSYQAAHDPLTGLINRREFERQLGLSVQSARGDGVSHVLCYLDLDRFKAVNDTCGHLAGDTMLREVATLAREHVRESDVLGRLGGDEFGMLLVGCPLEKARQIAGDVCSAVKGYRFAWQDRVFSIGASVGLVEIGPASGTMEELLSAADSACYVAKQRGRNQVHVYSARDETAARQRGEIHWLQKLQTALRENRFELFVQPIISVAGRIVSGPAVEVLLRMQDDDGSLIAPGNFLRAAERYQLMGSIDRWVVQAALALVGQGAIRLPDSRSCAINISGQSMMEDGFLEYVVECLDHSKVEPAQICFEVSESAVLANLEQTRRFIGVLHGMGCYFSLDDFGSGIGSLASLQGLNIDFLKIDGACTRNLDVDTVNQEVVSAVTRMSRAVGFKVVAEQVEDQPTFDELRQLGVNFIQGNYVEAPRRLGTPSSNPLVH